MTYYLTTYAPISKVILDRAPFATLDDALGYVAANVVRQRLVHVPLPWAAQTYGAEIGFMSLAKPGAGAPGHTKTWWEMHAEWLGPAHLVQIESAAVARSSRSSEVDEGNKPAPLRAF